MNRGFASSVMSLLSDVHTVSCISVHELISFIYFLIHLFISAGLIGASIVSPIRPMVLHWYCVGNRRWMKAKRKEIAVLPFFYPLAPSLIFFRFLRLLASTANSFLCLSSSLILSHSLICDKIA